jgi:Tfp pilus assembly protein PilX
MNKNKINDKGFALLLALIVSSIALSIGLSMLHITLKQLTLGTNTRGSEIAFQAASAGLECARFVRNEQSAAFISGSSVTINCLGASQTITPVVANGNIYRYNYPNLDWNAAGENLCIDMDIYVVDASTVTGSGTTYTFPNSVNRTCTAGDVCTFGFVRGYNRGCTDVSNNLFTLQRELTVEF